MKFLDKKVDICIQCHECERLCSEIWFKDENKEKSCIKIDEDKDSPNILVCTQCGECINSCPVHAIYRDRAGIVRINKNICVGCFVCVGFCPEEAMFMHEEYIVPFKCTACGQCISVCPTNAVSIVEKQTETE